MLSPRLHLPALLLATALSAGCADTFAGVSNQPAGASQKVQQLSTAFANRFTNPNRSGRFETARRKLVTGALVPSRVYRDTAVWTSSLATSGHRLTATGSLTERGYRFDMPGTGGRPDNVGDTWHSIILQQLSDDEFRWETNVDYAIGPVTAPDIGSMIGALLAAPQDRRDAELRASTLGAFPRAAAIGGRLFSLDSIRSTPGPNGTTTVALVLGLHADRLKPTYPALSAYIARYGNDAKYRFLLTDRGGTPIFQMTARDRVVRVSYRLQNGKLVTYTGTPRVMPDTMQLVVDATMKIKFWEVGFHNLTTSFIVGRGPRDRSWTMIARKEPQWKLPLVAERLLRTPLRRPFKGQGAMFQLGVSDAPGGQTIFRRWLTLEVEESPILRFLNGLASRVFDDLDETVEREEAIFLRSLFLAFQRDATALIGTADSPP